VLSYSKNWLPLIIWLVPAIGLWTDDCLPSLSNSVDSLVSVFHMFPESTRNLEWLSKRDA
jgi:hypothetical protein